MTVDWGSSVTSHHGLHGRPGVGRHALEGAGAGETRNECTVNAHNVHGTCAKYAEYLGVGDVWKCWSIL